MLEQGRGGLESAARATALCSAEMGRVDGSRQRGGLGRRGVAGAERQAGGSTALARQQRGVLDRRREDARPWTMNGRAG